MLFWNDLPMELYRCLFHKLLTHILILNYNLYNVLRNPMPIMYSNRTNGTELTSTSSTYRLETNLQLSVTFSIQDEDLVIKLWPYDVINCACIIKMKRCRYMMMQTAQIWRNNKYFRSNILIYIYIYIYIYIVYFSNDLL